MNYLEIYYWLLIIAFFTWVIMFLIGYSISVQYDSMGDIIKNDAYKNRQNILNIGFISMWVFIIGMLLFFFYLYMLVPLSKEERAETFPFNMMVKRNTNLLSSDTKNVL